MRRKFRLPAASASLSAACSSVSAGTGIIRAAEPLQRRTRASPL
jgi:hypothetical protein